MPGGRLAAWAIALAGAVLASTPGLLLSAVSGGRSRRRAVVGRSLAAAAERLGPAAIKMAQIAAARRDLLPREITDELARLHDDVASPAADGLARALAAAYAKPVGQLFAEIEQEPVAAGSVAVVFRGRAIDGEVVAIKLVRPGVACLVEADLQLLEGLVRRARTWRRLAHLPLTETFGLFAEQVRRQCDMVQEARATERFQAMIGHLVTVPSVRHDLSNATVMVSQWRDGGLRISDPALPETAFRAACLSLLQALYRMIFTHGLTHLDLHPGNVRVSDEGVVTLYDFGLTASIDPVDRDRFRNLMSAVVKADAAACVHHLIASAGRTPPGLDRRRLEDDMTALLRRYSGKSAGEFLVVGFVGALFELQNRHGLYGAPGFANAVWALALFEGLVRDRFPTLDFQGELRAFEVDQFVERIRASARNC